jgi:hypothetical protein
MMQADVTSARKRLTTPRAAAIAGIAFALLFTASIVLIGLSIPDGLQERGAWLQREQDRVVLALTFALRRRSPSATAGMTEAR